MPKFGMGWKKQPFDDRDLKYSTSVPMKGLPPEKDLENLAPAVFNQGQLGACTGHGIKGCIMLGLKKARLPTLDPSRLMIYFLEREMEGSIPDDAGAIIRDGIKACNRTGIAPEDLWPYDISRFAMRPPYEAYEAAAKNKIRFYASVDNRSVDNIRLAVFHEVPVVFGITLFDNFDDYAGGILQHPHQALDESIGGHCMYIIGYDDSKSAFKVRNSWGNDWGENGNVWISYEYMTSRLVSDLWAIRMA